MSNVSRLYNAGELFNYVAAETQVRSEHYGAWVGIQTGIAPFDQVIKNMFDEASLTIVSGPSGGGKTAFTSQLAVAAAAQTPVLWLSLEDDPKDVARRCLANIAREDITSLRTGFASGSNPESVQKAVEYVADLPLQIMETHGSVVDIVREIVAWAEHNSDPGSPNPGVVIVDQLSHIGNPTKADIEFWNQHPELGVKTANPNDPDHKVLEYNTAAIRAVAAHYGLTVVLLHQLNQTRGEGGALTQGSIRGSQGINHKADNVIGIQEIMEESPFPGSDTHGKPGLVKSDCSNFVCLKGRRIQAGWSVKLWFDGKHQRWADPIEKMNGVGEYLAPSGISQKARDAAAALRSFRDSTALPQLPSAPAPQRQIPAATTDNGDEGWDPNELEARR